MIHEVPANSLLMPEAWRATDVRDFAELVLEIAAARGVGRPILVTPDLLVLNRHEEAAACRMLNLRSVQVDVVDLEGILADGAGDHGFLPSEIIAVGRKLEEILKPAADERRAQGRARGGAIRTGKPIDSYPPPVGRRSSVREVVALLFGISVTTYSRAREVVLAAEEDPAQFGEFVKEMDKTENISGTCDEVRRRLKPIAEAQAQAEQAQEAAPRRKAAGSLFKVMPGRGAMTVVQNTLYALLAAAETFDTLDLSLVTPDLAADWADDLKTVSRSLTKFRSRLTDLAKESVNGQQ